MNNFLSSRRALVATSVLAAANVLVMAGCAVADPPPSPQSGAVIAYAREISHLVTAREIKKLAALKPPAAKAKLEHDGGLVGKLMNPPMSTGMQELNHWRETYVRRVERARKIRHAQYIKDIQRAHHLMAKGDAEGAVINLLGAYRITRQTTAFRRKPWVLAMAKKISARAASYEKKGRWLESLELYTDLNSLYKISMRYLADKHRLDRRTALLAMYTPKVIYQMQKKLLAMELEKAKKAGMKTKPKLGPSKNSQKPVFSNWHKEVAAARPYMLTESLGEAEHYWVTPVSYNHLIIGGVKNLRLFLTTPELAQAFPNLANATDRRKFALTLNHVMDQAAPGQQINSGQVRHIRNEIMAADKQTVDIPSKVITMEFTNGAFDSLDPFSMVIWPYEAAEFEKEIQGRFSGIGIQISLRHDELKVVSPLEHSPAFDAGIQAGDVITSINGHSTAGITIDGAVHDITGKPGTYVHLVVRRPGVAKLLNFRVERKTIKVRSIKGYTRNKANDNWRYMIDPRDKIAYIRITGFENDTATELKAALHHLKREHVRGIILDLRFNPGGLLETAVKMCNMFLNRATIVSTKNRVGRRHVWKADADPYIPMKTPMIVLVNQYSASASEIFTGAMRDMKRAMIIGHRSYGKGCVQHLIPLNPKETALLKLTMAYYYLPDGECLHRFPGSRNWGVNPKIPVQMTPAQLLALREIWLKKDIIPADHIAQSRSLSLGNKKAGKGKKIAKPVRERSFDTQLDTALLMMRLKLMQRPA